MASKKSKKSKNTTPAPKSLPGPVSVTHTGMAAKSAKKAPEVTARVLSLFPKIDPKNVSEEEVRSIAAVIANESAVWRSLELLPLPTAAEAAAYEAEHPGTSVFIIDESSAFVLSATTGQEVRRSPLGQVAPVGKLHVLHQAELERCLEEGRLGEDGGETYKVHTKRLAMLRHMIRSGGQQKARGQKVAEVTGKPLVEVLALVQCRHNIRATVLDVAATRKAAKKAASETEQATEAPVAG